MYMYYLYTNDIELIVYEVQQCGVDVLFRQKFDENLKMHIVDMPVHYYNWWNKNIRIRQ